jgi:hypothetical protein
LHHPNKIDRNEIGHRKNHRIPRGEKLREKRWEEKWGRAKGENLEEGDRGKARQGT